MILPVTSRTEQKNSNRAIPPNNTSCAQSQPQIAALTSIPDPDLDLDGIREPVDHVPPRYDDVAIHQAVLDSDNPLGPQSHLRGGSFVVALEMNKQDLTCYQGQYPCCTFAESIQHE